MRTRAFNQEQIIPISFIVHCCSDVLCCAHNIVASALLFVSKEPNRRHKHEMGTTIVRIIAKIIMGTITIAMITIMTITMTTITIATITIVTTTTTAIPKARAREKARVRAKRKERERREKARVRAKRKAKARREHQRRIRPPAKSRPRVRPGGQRRNQPRHHRSTRPNLRLSQAHRVTRLAPDHRGWLPQEHRFQILPRRLRLV